MTTPPEAPQTDAQFLLGMLPKIGLLSLEEERRIKEIATNLEPPPEDDSQAGLNRWSSRDWDRRGRQTGMEKQNEKVVLELLNLFSGMNIPFYILDSKTGQKTGKEYTIPERLAKLKAKISDSMRAAEQLAERARKEGQEAKRMINEASQRIEAYQLAANAAIAELGTTTESIAAAARAKVILENVEPTENTVLYGTPDHAGVRRVTLDARVVVLRLCMQRIVHHLTEHEALCPTCLGLGLIKPAQTFGVGETKPGEDRFPYWDQWLAQCPTCYMGKVNLCSYCKEVIPRHRTRCECKAADLDRRMAIATHEAERQAKLPRVKLADYHLPLVWCDTTDRYIDTGDLYGHLEDHPDAVIFACELSAPLAVPDADEIMERLKDEVNSSMNPEDGDPALEFKDEAQAELELKTFLAKWAEAYVELRDLYYPNMNLMVEIPHDTRVDDVPEVQPDDDAGGG